MNDNEKKKKKEKVLKDLLSAGSSEDHFSHIRWDMFSHDSSDSNAWPFEEEDNNSCISISSSAHSSDTTEDKISFPKCARMTVHKPSTSRNHLKRKEKKQALKLAARKARVTKYCLEQRNLRQKKRDDSRIEFYNISI